MGEGDDDAVAAAHEAVELLLRLREPAGCDRRPLRLEGEGLRLRERIELGRPLQPDRIQPLLRPDAAHLVGLPDEVRPAVEHEHEVVRDGSRLVVVGERHGVVGVDPALRRGMHDRVVDRMQGALRERREDADTLDLVTEELHPERLATRGREDVDDPAAHRELAALLRAVDALVAGERELLGEPAHTGLGADLEPDRGRSSIRRGHALRERGGRGADEPSGGEDLERARTLADEMRRRLEAGAPANAAAGQQRDALGPEEPARRLGRVARVGILGQQADEPAPVARVAESCSWSAASSSGSTGSDTRARAGSAAA